MPQPITLSLQGAMEGQTIYYSFMQTVELLQKVWEGALEPPAFPKGQGETDYSKGKKEA